MRVWRLLCLLSLSLSVSPRYSRGQAVGQSAHDKAVLRLLHDADGLPFEFRADIQLNVLENNPGLSKQVAGETLQRLFTDAPSAQYRFRQSYLDYPPGVGTLARDLAQAQGLNLDMFSVRARVVRLLDDVDARVTLRLLKDTALQVAPLSCSAAMVDDPSAYYDALAEVLPKVWDKTNTPPLERLTFVQQRIDEITSPVQIAPMARILAKLHRTKPAPIPMDRLAQLDDAFAGLLSRTTGSDRELSAVGDDISKSLEELLVENHSDSGRVRLLLNGLGDFWRKNINEPRCADLPRRRRREIEAFDSLAIKYFPDQSVPAIGPAKADSAPLGTLPETVVVPDFTDAVPLDLLQSLSAYRDAGVANIPPSEESRRAVEEDVTQAIQLAEAIVPSDHLCTVCAFEEKREVLFFLFDRAPSEVSRERALDAVVKVLATDDTQELSRVQWLWHVHFLLNLARGPNKKQADQIATFMVGKDQFFPFLPRPDDQLILDAFVRSGSQVLVQYVSAEKVLKNEYVLPPYVTASLSAHSSQ